MADEDDTWNTVQLSPHAPGRRAARALTFHPVDREHYELGDEIARGGMGRIVAAHDKRLGRRVAIKELLNASADLRARFEREARITAQLQHPNIVNILDAGSWPDGSPFYVMKLVSGSTLDKVIKQKPALADRLSLVPNAIAVVDALAYAHSHRVIHRDLKPANVLIGDFGETVVIDWGIAKDLSSDDNDASATRTMVADGTIVGDVLGTPAYMAPEQAAGARVDERADVYALGALLYHILAGKAPYADARSSSSEEIIARVKDRAPAPLAERAPGAPPDLIAIVEKAMARDPKDRYANAGEVAVELKQYQTGQLVSAHRYTLRQLLARWVRRHRTAVIVAALASVTIVVLAAIGLRRIFAEQAIAEKRREESERVLAFMLTDLDRKLRTVGKLDLLADVANEAIDHFEKRGDDLAADELGLDAIAHEIKSEAAYQAGSSDLADAELQKSLVLRNRQLALAPADPKALRGMATLHVKLGDHANRRGLQVDALEHYQVALGWIERAPATDRDATTQLIGTLDRLASMKKGAGDLAGAEPLYKRALATCEALVVRDANDQRANAMLAGMNERLGDLERERGNIAEAGRRFEADFGISDRWLAKHPDDAEAKVRRMLGRSRVISIVRRTDLARARVLAQTSLDEIRALRAFDPSNMDWVGFELFMLLELANIATDLRPALHKEALASAHRLAATDKHNATWQGHLTMVLHDVATDAFERGALDEAEALVREEVAIADTLVMPNASFGNDDHAAIAYEDLGILGIRRNDPKLAIPALERVLAARTKRSAESPIQLDFRAQLASVQTRLAEAYVLAGRRDEAKRLYQGALDNTAAILAVTPDPDATKLHATAEAGLASKAP